MKQLVIFGHMDDPHSTSVSLLLSRQFGVSVVYFDPIALDRKSIELSESVVTTEIFGEDVETRGPTAVQLDNCLLWWRSKRQLHYLPRVEDQPQYFAIKENTAFMRGLVSIIEIPHFNSLQATRQHNSKVFQLNLARSIGLIVPPTLISTDRDKILSFFDEHGNIISKSLESSFVPPAINDPASSLNLMVRAIERDEIVNAHPEQFAIAPAIYQSNVQKAYELRVIVFGDEARFFKIDSQNSRFGRQDWRKATQENIYSSIDVDSELMRLASNYLRAAGLHYGVFDFIQGLDGDFHFLECNSDGQWAWLESEDKPIANLFANQIYEMLK